MKNSSSFYFTCLAAVTAAALCTAACTASVTAAAKPDAVTFTVPVQPDTTMIHDSMTVAFLKKHLRKGTPRLILTPDMVKQLKAAVKSDPVVGNLFKAFRLNGEKIMTKPLLTYHKTGKRLLSVSREMLYRVNILAMLYVIDGDKKALGRLDQELRAVCNFQNWNPTHFLDVAEMSMAVSLALDWTGGHLPAATRSLAIDALIHKGIEPSYGKGMWWIEGTNNWNQVCNGGMIAASLAIAEKDPELAAKTISRSLKGMPHALDEYAPDGVYPEGATYWNYGTTFSALTSSMLETALGTDFGLSEYRPLMQSAVFRLLSVAPSGDFYNFSDCGTTRGKNGDMTLAWFAARTLNGDYFEGDRFLRSPDSMGTLPRYAGAGLVWITDFQNRSKKGETHPALPLDWKGGGATPVVFFRGGPDDPHHYYLGAKGGTGNHSHGNLDAGSFIFELNGVRWVVDPGTQDYYDVEKTGFDLWGMCQNCDRWKLLTKNNFGHSTVTVNGARFDVAAYVPITSYHGGAVPEATMDMSGLYDGAMASFTRKFVKESDHSLVVEDKLRATDSTRLVTWQLITTADVELVPTGAVLHQDGKQLKVELLSTPRVEASVISLDPPPLKLDKVIHGLKRLEFRFPAYLFTSGTGTIRVRLSSE
jgi:hypothetical protein